jgi:hypothetical protein
VPELCRVESNHRITHKGQPVIQVCERVPGERPRMVVQGRRTEDNSQCTVIVIHEQNGTWTIHGLGNQGIRLPPADMSTLAKEILSRTP